MGYLVMVKAMQQARLAKIERFKFSRFMSTTVTNAYLQFTVVWLVKRAYW